MSQDVSMRPAAQPPRRIPILLLKTRSLPHDTYEEYLSSPTTSAPTSTPDETSSHPPISFSPTFVPVLEHKQDEETLNELGQLLKTGRLKERYGGMIFTSQRAVEGWADTVMRVEKEAGTASALTTSTTATDTRTGQTFHTDILSSTPFPLYVVGPATGRALSTLLSTLQQPQTQPSPSPSSPTPVSPFFSLHPTIEGTHTGSGAVLGPFILSHYNALHAETWYTFHDAPRLPFVPLLGMGSENYSRRRLETGDPRLVKRPLLFLVGEVRRDVIPRALMDARLGKDRVEVVEREVYSTVVREGFRTEFEGCLRSLDEGRENGRGRSEVVVIVVFSPQGSGDMLKAIGFVDAHDRVTDKAKRRWEDVDTETGQKYVIATIGPTTRDHLRDTFGFEPDVCAKKPSPEGVREGVEAFLRAKWMI